MSLTVLAPFRFLQPTISRSSQDDGGPHGFTPSLAFIKLGWMSFLTSTAFAILRGHRGTKLTMVFMLSAQYMQSVNVLLNGKEQ